MPPFLWKTSKKLQSTLVKSQFPVRALGRSRPAADATREAVERWLLDGLM